MATHIHHQDEFKIQAPTYQRQKLCFVTVGATVSFDKLVHAVISVPFLEALVKANYTQVRVQYGRAGQKEFDDALSETKKLGDGRLPGDIIVTGIDMIVNSRDMDAALIQILPRYGHDEGMLISHAGTGSIMAGLMGGAPIVAVPNPDLADNHQQEIANAFAKRHWVIYGDVSDLVPVVQQAEEWREEMSKPIRQQWQDEKLAPTKYEEQIPSITIHDIMRQELGF